MKPAAKRTRQPRMLLEVRREQVLDGALRLLNRGGYAAVTMEAVSREVELAKPRVYAAYPGVEPLLLALLERERDRALATLTVAMPTFDAGAKFDDILVAAATNLLQAVEANPDSWRPLLIPPNDAPQQVRDNFEAGRQFALAQLRALLEWGRDQRPGLADIDLDLMAISLLAVGEQGARMVLNQPEEFTAQRFANFTRSLLDQLPPHT
ncbi:TetR/AcrR family transcriptional regulator [Antrihabitans sp. YC2-6]|uniref:TetR/AcrR family transcriptional regulator n=1 Tax=Antrihabitans sp. YC2-6 TaxID=2799498 RepID=UPI0018F2E4F9|nr:TetR family transcriptional regulator [Antrihabitans sp. YC2-6]MBJ8346928.1 helix-turn-helix transcriptional regulator [Antrihabitans sp. YC2-6]